MYSVTFFFALLTHKAFELALLSRQEGKNNFCLMRRFFTVIISLRPIDIVTINITWDYSNYICGNINKISKLFNNAQVMHLQYWGQQGNLWDILFSKALIQKYVCNFPSQNVR